jgi:ATP-dependent protease HslVU (ClpYQ) peptidase subunit
MTTLAFDGITLAADSAVSDGEGGTKTRYNHKLRRFADGRIAGFCGDLTAGIELLDWLEEDGDAPVPKITGDAMVMVVQPDGGIFNYDKRGIPMDVDEPIAALGSGHEYALGAMMAGAPAEIAVHIAIERDPHSGFDVLTLDLQGTP